MRPSPRRSPVLLSGLLVAGLAIGGGVGYAGAATPRVQATADVVTGVRVARADASVAARAVPRLRVTPIVRKLDHPWDVVSIGRGRLLYSQRDRATLSVWRAGKTHGVKFPSESVWVSGETGLMGLAVDPDFATTRTIYACHGGFLANGGHDVRVDAYRLNPTATRATFVRKLLGGFPTSSGRHGGCRLLIAKDGSMIIGTGDAAQGRNPRNLKSLGGKTLRLDPKTGAPWPTNRFVHSANHAKRYIHTYGHRNVQGVAQRADGTLWSAEQGTYRDDEVNELVNGGDYGYNPVPGYNESVPMTDQSLPGTQIAAKWRSGDPTIATCGANFVYGKQWGALNGALAVAVEKGTRVIFLSFSRTGRLVSVRTPPELARYGRIRQVRQGPGGALLVTTDNGGGEDSILRVTPR